MGPKPYRTVRWGKHLQIWLVEGREYRTPNKEPDGPDKTIWGDEQKRWLKRTIAASDADWRVLISPTPLVGPDRDTKGDNHANRAYATEGREIRQWIADNAAKNLFVVCGDRHWQYHSIDPQTQVNEFSVGPASDQHAGGTPGHDPAYHQFHRVAGGFLSVEVKPVGKASTIAFRLHDVHGKVVYEHQPEMP
jgi:alkaline phosphatase D